MTNELNNIEEFLEKFPDYGEVQSLLELFKEIANPPYDRRDRTVFARTNQKDLLLRLSKLDNGARLSFGFYDESIDQFWEKASIYAGLTPTGVWAYGKGNEQQHDVRFNVGDNYLSNEAHKQIFELMKESYEKFKDVDLDTQCVFDGSPR